MRLGARAKAWCAGFVVLGSLLVPTVQSHAEIGAPDIWGPGQNSLQAGAAPQTVKVWGIAPPSTVVEVFDNLTNSMGTTTAGSNKAWSINLLFTNGTHTIDAVATDINGEHSLPSTAITFEVDAVSPGGTMSKPADAHAFGPGETLEFAGTASDDRGLLAVRMRYWRLDTIVLEKLADCDGCDGGTSATWSDRPVLQPGYYVVTATAIDKAGNQRELAHRTFTTGLEGVPMVSPPTAPSIPGAPDVPMPDPSSPNPGSLIPAAEKPVAFRGSGDPGQTIEGWETKAGLGPIGSVQTNKKGYWKLNAVLPSGSYAVTFRAIDEDGNPSPWTDLLAFKVDADRPAVSILTDDNSVFLPLQAVTIQGATSDNRGVSRIFIDYWLGNTLVARDRASCLGCPRRDIHWSDMPALEDPGYYLARVRGYDKAGNASFVREIHFIKVI